MAQASPGQVIEEINGVNLARIGTPGPSGWLQPPLSETGEPRAGAISATHPHTLHCTHIIAGIIFTVLLP